MSARLPALVQRAGSAPEESEWHVAVMDALGPELGVKVTRITLNSGRITVNAQSAAWAARMRFQLADLTPRLAQITPEFRELIIRVRPARSR
jgi:hypothetical protein